MDSRAGLRRLLVTAAVLAAALLAPATAAGVTKTVTFDDLAPDTRVWKEYEISHGVTFPSYPGTRPLVRSVGARAHSGDRVGVNRCDGLPDCGEVFTPPVLHGQLIDSGDAVSAYVGYYRDPAYPINPGDPVDTLSVRIRAYNVDNALVGESPYVTVIEDAAFDQQVTATAAAGQRIDHFEIVADNPGENTAGKSIGFDDLAFTIDDAAPPAPPNMTLNEGETVVNVLTGTSVDVPVDLNRINSSNGDVSFAVSGLPTGMAASFNPNPVPGTGNQTTMTLTAAEGAAASDNYTEITITASPSPGAGPSQRSITKLVRIRENCARTVRFPYVDARSDGCLVKRGTSTYDATNTEVRVNGLVIKPADDSHPTLVIDNAKKTIKGARITMPFTVSVDSDPDIPIYAGPIDWDFSKGGSGPREVIGVDISGVKKLKGLPITGLNLSFLESGKSRIKPTLRLGFWPFNYFGSITTSTTFTADNDHGADFTGLDIKVANINALALELKDVQLKWQTGDTWSGSAKLVLKFGKPYTVGAGFGIKNGDFDFLRGSISGLNTSIGAGIFLQSIGFEVHRSPLSLEGTIGLSGGPAVAGRKAVTVNGGLKLVFDDPFVVEVNGKVEVADTFELGDAFVRYSSNGLFEFGGEIDWDFEIIYLNGNVAGWVDGLDAFNVEGSLTGCIRIKYFFDPCASAKALISSIGIAGCIGGYGYYVGAAATWALPPDFDAFTGCDLGPWRATQSSARGGAHVSAEPTRHTLAAGLPAVAWAVDGDGDAPGITLTGPNGEPVTVSKDVPFVTNDRFIAGLGEDNTTYVVVKKPAAGVWTLSDDGSVPIKQVRQALGLPEPSATANVTGRGRSRVLHWRLKQIDGQRVKLAEVGKDVRNVIATTTAKRGAVRFRPADGPAGKRQIVALVEQNGHPRTTLTAGSYRAPGPLKPGRPRSLTVNRRGSRLIVKWRPNPSRFRHAVFLALSDGRRIARVLGAGRRSFTLKGVPSRVGAKVRVLGLTQANGKGPAARASIRAKRRR